MKNIAVFASGSGSNFQALVNAVETNELQASIKLLVCDKPKAYVVERAANHSIDVFAFSAKDYPSKVAYEMEILQKLKDYEIDLIILAGYMRLIGDTLLQAFPGRIVNIHPSLLPNFPGKDAVGQALSAGAKETGVTVHYVDEGMDTGPIIAQESVGIAAGETNESLQAKIQRIEHGLYPKVVQTLVLTKI
ncbi:phosphoribosylglycinamide formyltransferase [Niallia taxi]|uniref:phosphoribosylglycinamide formyltransferase n=1 Tax=Niallia taxi TaxID=2499688 RepID=UPI002E1A1878|nr:phosphoribosylglycinamide formyltransferase [Niallia taxi]MED3965267.1 phosphoribosylglycinamide formyltransferase [Niallia taxi]